MRVRHKTPTLVSMWMLDVFCCALGCVTLLWLLNTRQASDQAEANVAQGAANKATAEELERERAALAAASLRVANLDAKLQQLSDKLSAAEADRRAIAGWLSAARAESVRLGDELDKTRSALTIAQADSDAVKGTLIASRDDITKKDKELARAKARVKVVENDLLQKKQETDALTKKLTESAAAATELARLVREKTAERLALETKRAELQAKLDDANARLTTSRTDQTKADAKAKAAAARIAELEEQAEKSRLTIIDLQADKKRLDTDLQKAVRETDNRFAGIAMTGSRVVFLVDMSGSMMALGPRREDRDADKWPSVARTVAKVMRSISTLREYQVVLFSTEARWLFNDGGVWRKYQGEATAKELEAAMLKVMPEGGTNMHAGFDLAFTLRTPSNGLDTIYLFSDGLPTIGPDLPANATTDELRSAFLAPRLRERLRMVKNRPEPGITPTRVPIHSVGFFYESPDVGAFLWGMSRENGGSFVGMSRP